MNAHLISPQQRIPLFALRLIPYRQQLLHLSAAATGSFPIQMGYTLIPQSRTWFAFFFASGHSSGVPRALHNGHRLAFTPRLNPANECQKNSQKAHRSAVVLTPSIQYILQTQLNGLWADKIFNGGLFPMPDAALVGVTLAVYISRYVRASRGSQCDDDQKPA